MPRPPSTAIAAALAAIRSGTPWRVAAKTHGVTMSGISKAIKREAALAASERCLTCGHILKESEHVADD